MESLLERIEDNKLDALYLFINETLRVRDEFDRFFNSLMVVLPVNWSIQRVEVGHEFLSMVSQQKRLFELLSSLEGLRTLIISDGYVPRKDRGSINTRMLLEKLTRAKNLQILDLQRLQLNSSDEVQLLADFLELQESLEELRITGLFLSNGTSLNPAIEACCLMPNLRSLCISNSREEDLIQQEDTSNIETIQRPLPLMESSLQNLLQSSTTLQDLSLRSMYLTDEQCLTIADALSKSSFLTSLDIRQNDQITKFGYAAILQALERNFDLWCSVLVDNDTYQAKFNSLIELNQANRGDLLRSPTKEKLITFLDTLKDDPTALFHFFTIHDAILYPTVNFLVWKCKYDERKLKKSKPVQEPRGVTFGDTTENGNKRKRSESIEK